MTNTEIGNLAEEILDDFAADGAEFTDEAAKVELYRDFIDAGCEPVEALFRLMAVYEDQDDALLAELRRTPAEVADQRRSCEEIKWPPTAEKAVNSVSKKGR